jgi:hypothetical protein
MTTRPQPGPEGGWSIGLGKGSTAFGRDGFPTAEAASDWAEMAAAALKASTIRIGPKRIIGTGAEALRRWAIDQGTLPRAEGGTHLAPLARLQSLMADPACALPLAALKPEDLAGLRARRRATVGSESAMLVEQAALAVAIDELTSLYLPRLEQPFHRLAPDGLSMPDDAHCAGLISRCLATDAELGRAVGLILTTGIAPPVLLASRTGDWNPRTQRLYAQGLELAWPGGLATPAGAPGSLLLGRLSAPSLAAAVLRIGGKGLNLPGLWLAGLRVALRDGRHLDEALALAGLHSAAAPRE